MSVPADLNLVGVIDDIPAASSAYNGKTYFATDEDGGTFYRCNGTNWVKVAAAVGEGSASPSIPADGWIAADALAYVSTDDPTGVVDATGDQRTKYYVGMRLKMTNGGNTIYGKITDVNQTLQSGNTRITFLHEIDPSDSQAKYLLANSAITNPYYSPVFAPAGFPLDPAKWSILVEDTTIRNQDNITGNGWYNLGSLSIVIPIGSWFFEYYGVVEYFPNAASSTNLTMTLSTANNSESDIKNSALIWGYSNGAAMGSGGEVCRKLFLNLDAKTTYYLNEKSEAGGAGKSLYLRSDLSSTVLRATLAF